MQELKSGDLIPLQTAWNKESMVAWINQSLTTRARHDVRKSYVYYDADKDFVTASIMELEPSDKASLERRGIKFWSKGIV